MLFLAQDGSSVTLRADDSSATGWQHDFAAAEAQAKAQQVALVVHFHASWCGPCRRMESEVLSNSQVTSLLGKGIIGVKVDSDRHRDLVSRFGVRALPTDVIVSPDGKVLAKDVGSPGLSGYVARLKQHLQTPATSPAQIAVAAVQTTPAEPAEVAPADPPPVPAVPAAPVATPAEKPVAATEPPVNPAVTAEPAAPAAPVVPAAPVTPAAPAVATATAPAEPAAPPATTESDAPATAAAPAETGLTPAEVAAALRDETKLLIRRENARVGLGGYSPIAHASNAQWVAGQQEFAAEFQGVRYLLASAAELDQFKAAPEKFIPALHGCDPVALIRDQKVQSGFIGLRVEHASRVYFFTTPENRDLFLSDPGKFSSDRSLVFFQAEDRGNKS
jgi:thiol-disulfide isomerase/thioredoxin/YHS domain-containing protein